MESEAMTLRKESLTHFLLLILAVSAILVIVSGREWTGSIASTVQPQMPGPDAQQLWKHITKDNPYKSWKTFPNLPRYIHVDELPHGDWVAAYVNGEAYDSVNSPSYPFQMKYGSIIVKENYSLTNGDPSPQSPLTSVPVALTSLTVMYKVKGYQKVPGEEEWFWVMYGCNNGQCDGSVVTISNQPWIKKQIPGSTETFAFFSGEVVAGKPWFCIECHQRAKQAGQFALGDYAFKINAFAP